MEKDEEKKSKNNGLGPGFMVILVVLFLVGGVLGFAASKILDEPINKDNTEEKEIKETKEKEEKIALDDSKFIDVYNNLKAYTYSQNRENGYKSFTNEELSTIAIEKLVESDFTKTGENDEWGRPYFTFSADKMIENLKKYFDKDVTFDFNSIVNKSHGYNTKVDIDYQGSIMNIISYDSSSKTYKVRFSGGGGTTPPKATVVERKITNATIKGDTITIEEKAIYYKNDVDLSNNKSVYNIYSDPKMSNSIDAKTYDLDKVDKETISIDSYIDKATTIIHTFKYDKDNSKYYFASSLIK